MVEELSIDNELLISLVEQNPVLWDKSLELYKNRVATQAAWKGIMQIIDPDFETKEEKTRQGLAKMIIQRWTHIRDNYNRSYKKIKDQKSSGSGAKTSKPYVYSKQLSFLQKVIQSRESYEGKKRENETLETNSLDTDDKMVAKCLTTYRVPKRSLEQTISSVDAKMIKFIDSSSNNKTVTMNRHLSFFNGILPSLDKYDDDEVLEFQMGVLQLMKKIKNSRKIRESTSFDPSTTHGVYFTQQYQNNNIQGATNSISTVMSTKTSPQSTASDESCYSD